MDPAYQPTGLERRMENILTSLGIEFEPQVPTKEGFIVDFAIYVDWKAGKKIAIETDGSKWHSSHQQRKRDRFRDMKLRKGGWMVLRFGEIFTPSEVKEKIDTAIRILSPV